LLSLLSLLSLFTPPSLILHLVRQTFAPTGRGKFKRTSLCDRDHQL
jgi:hypothetical protein